MMLLSEIGVRLWTAAAGAGSVILAASFDNPAMRLVAILLAVMFLGPLVVLLVMDVRECLGRPPPQSDPTGRPRAVEWGCVVFFDGVMALFVYAGVLDAQRGGSGELLITGVMVSAVMLFLTSGVVARWWRHRRARRCGRLTGGPE
ncbi:hypothetical protein [Streptomyces sp. BB1-1-1]|uniref:hypothetical protein n=1 Tax=unclassified Streptomyces TaxID=2593676 RepID=UPI0028773B92|nr:hypothetical protein [Streptomyces sp. BB1-1-1]WND32938.1 hypothetical protein RI578_00860 [Streptomyces sp. BB1-1-1]